MVDAFCLGKVADMGVLGGRYGWMIAIVQQVCGKGVKVRVMLLEVAWWPLQ